MSFSLHLSRSVAFTVYSYDEHAHLWCYPQAAGLMPVASTCEYQNGIKYHRSSALIYLDRLQTFELAATTPAAIFDRYQDSDSSWLATFSPYQVSNPPMPEAHIDAMLR